MRARVNPLTCEPPGITCRLSTCRAETAGWRPTHTTHALVSGGGDLLQDRRRDCKKSPPRFSPRCRLIASMLAAPHVYDNSHESFKHEKREVRPTLLSTKVPHPSSAVGGNHKPNAAVAHWAGVASTCHLTSGLVAATLGAAVLLLHRSATLSRSARVSTR